MKKLNNIISILKLESTNNKQNIIEFIRKHKIVRKEVTEKLLNNVFIIYNKQKHKLKNITNTEKKRIFKIYENSLPKNNLTDKIKKANKRLTRLKKKHRKFVASIKKEIQEEEKSTFYNP
jgi:vacuolar-type H+-ATPase subunit I/STV1